MILAAPVCDEKQTIELFKMAKLSIDVCALWALHIVLHKTGGNLHNDTMCDCLVHVSDKGVGGLVDGVCVHEKKKPHRPYSTQTICPLHRFTITHLCF